MSDGIIDVPPSVPQTRNRIRQWLGRTILRLGGWRIVGDLPDVPRALLLAAPHSSAWDALWGLAAKLALRLDITFMAKAELFRIPLLGWWLRQFGAVPVNRFAPNGAVGQAIAVLQSRPQVWFVLAPEGTRRRVERWRTGFWHIARGAGVPVICAYFHYPSREVGFGEVMEMTDDLEADMARVRAFYRPWVGKRRGTV